MYKNDESFVLDSEIDSASPPQPHAHPQPLYMYTVTCIFCTCTVVHVHVHGIRLNQRGPTRAPRWPPYFAARRRSTRTQHTVRKPAATKAASPGAAACSPIGRGPMTSSREDCHVRRLAQVEEEWASRIVYTGNDATWQSDWAKQWRNSARGSSGPPRRDLGRSDASRLWESLPEGVFHREFVLLSEVSAENLRHPRSCRHHRCAPPPYQYLSLGRRH